MKRKKNPSFLQEIIRHLGTLKSSLVNLGSLSMNMSILYWLSEKHLIHYFSSGIIAIETAIIFNFFLKNLPFWSDPPTKPFGVRLIQHHLSLAISATLNWTLLILFTEWIALHYLISNLIGIICGAITNHIMKNVYKHEIR